MIDGGRSGKDEMWARAGGREAGEPVLEPTLVAGGMAGGTGRWEVGVSVSLPIKDAALCCEVLSLASYPLTPSGVERFGAAPIISRDSPPQPRGPRRRRRRRPLRLPFPRVDPNYSSGRKPISRSRSPHSPAARPRPFVWPFLEGRHTAVAVNPPSPPRRRRRRCPPLNTPTCSYAF